MGGTRQRGSREPRWPPRPAAARPAVDRVRDAAIELVDYLLFVDEAPLAAPIAGSSHSRRSLPPTVRATSAADRCGSSISNID